MKLNQESIQNQEAWLKLGIALPLFSVENMVKKTKEAPVCVHFGGGDSFRGNVASVYQRFLNNASLESGLIVVDKSEVLEAVYQPYDNLSLSMVISSEGTASCEVIGSVAEAVSYDNRARLEEIFSQSSLQIVSMSLAPEDYRLQDVRGEYLLSALSDMQGKPEEAKGRLSQMVSLLYVRYQKGALPLAVLSLDEQGNRSLTLKNLFVEIAKAWEKKGYVDGEFLRYLDGTRQVSFLSSLVDRLIVEPLDAMGAILETLGIEDMEVQTVEKKQLAGFFNMQREHYYALEQQFPNGAPPFQEAGIHLCKRRDVRLANEVKQCCGTSVMLLAIGMLRELLELDTVYQVVRHRDVLTLLQELSYEEAMPVLEEVSFLDTEEYIDQLLQVRLPHPLMECYLPYTVENISGKIPKYLKATLKGYDKGTAGDLTAVPLLIALWFRYSMGFSDLGQPYSCGADLRAVEIQEALKTVTFGSPDSYQEQFRGILSDSDLFGVDLCKLGLAESVEGHFRSLIAGAGAVERTLMDAMLAFGAG